MADLTEQGKVNHDWSAELKLINSFCLANKELEDGSMIDNFFSDDEEFAPAVSEPVEEDQDPVNAAMQAQSNNAE